MNTKVQEQVNERSTTMVNGVEIATLRPRKLAPSFNKFRFKTDHPGLYQEYMSEPTTTRALNIPKKIKSAIEGDNNVN